MVSARKGIEYAKSFNSWYLLSHPLSPPLCEVDITIFYLIDVETEAQRDKVIAQGQTASRCQSWM